MMEKTTPSSPATRRQQLLALAAQASKAWREKNKDGKIDLEYLEALKSVPSLPHLIQELVQSISFDSADQSVANFFRPSGSDAAQALIKTAASIPLVNRIAGLGIANAAQNRRRDAVGFLLQAAWQDAKNQGGFEDWRRVPSRQVESMIIDWAVDPENCGPTLRKIAITLTQSGLDQADYQRFGLASYCVPVLRLLSYTQKTEAAIA